MGKIIKENNMFSIVDKNVVKVENVEVITVITSAYIKEQIDTLKASIINSNDAIQKLSKELKEVTKLEGKLSKA